MLFCFGYSISPRIAVILLPSFLLHIITVNLGAKDILLYRANTKRNYCIIAVLYFNAVDEVWFVKELNDWACYNSIEKRRLSSNIFELKAKVLLLSR